MSMIDDTISYWKTQKLDNEGIENLKRELEWLKNSYTNSNGWSFKLFLDEQNKVGVGYQKEEIGTVLRVFSILNKESEDELNFFKKCKKRYSQLVKITKTEKITVEDYKGLIEGMRALKKSGLLKIGNKKLARLITKSFQIRLSENSVYDLLRGRGQDKYDIEIKINQIKINQINKGSFTPHEFGEDF